MDLSDQSKIKEVTARYKDCINSATGIRKYQSNQLIFLESYTKTIIEIVKQAENGGPCDDPTNMNPNLAHFYDFHRDMNLNLGKLGGLIVLPIDQLNKFISYTKNLKEVFKKNSHIISKKVINDIKEFKRQTEEGEKKFKYTQWTIEKQNTAANRPDKMYNPKELERLDQRADKNIKDFQDNKEKLDAIKMSIMNHWTDLSNIIKDNFSQLASVSRDITINSREIVKAFVQGVIATTKYWLDELEKLGKYCNTNIVNFFRKQEKDSYE